MTATILLTGFGPFPGAPFNPTAPLVERLAHSHHIAYADVRRIAHVFDVSYQAVDHELPALLRREQPDALIMFGLATRARELRIETRARNTMTRRVPDTAGRLPDKPSIAAGRPTEVPLRAPAHLLLLAARKTGVPVALSHNAGAYLCNYLCWRAAELDEPQFATFVHVPPVGDAPGPKPPWAQLGLDDLARAGDAILRATLVMLRTGRPMA
jgi:pyroglutamyl-peptidase